MTNRPILSQDAAPLGALRRTSPTVRTIVRSWRDLVGARKSAPKTLIACSGGADSTALALALATATKNLVVAHVLHDLRPRAEVEADRDAVAALAERLGLPFAQAEVSVRQGNREGTARKARYRELAVIAQSVEAPFVATAHHADDQFESVVMALLRGAGPAGMRGVATSRRLGEGLTLVRPMLGVTRAEARGLCEAAQAPWREDASNLDTTRTRAALRHGALPLLADLRPGAALRAAQSAVLLRDAVEVAARRAREVFGEGRRWDRAALRDESAIVIGHGLRDAAKNATASKRFDKLSRRVVDPVVRAIRDASTEPRRFDWPGGVQIRVTARSVELVHEESTRITP